MAKIDLRRGVVVRKVSTGSAPRSMDISPDGKALYVVNYYSNTYRKVRTGDMLQDMSVSSSPTDHLRQAHPRSGSPAIRGRSRSQRPPARRGSTASGCRAFQPDRPRPRARLASPAWARRRFRRPRRTRLDLGDRLEGRRRARAFHLRQRRQRRHSSRARRDRSQGGVGRERAGFPPAPRYALGCTRLSPTSSDSPDRFEEFAIVSDAIHDAGDVVVMQGRRRRPRPRERLDAPACWVWMVRDGRAVRNVNYHDNDAWRLALT